MPTKDALVAAFKAFDADGNGTLSASELVAVLTRPGGAAMSFADAEELIKTVDVNGDGELDVEEFCTLMATPGALTMLPAPSNTSADRITAFEAEAKSVKKSSPVKAIFAKLAAQDASLTALSLHNESDSAVNMEWSLWPDARKAAALALLCGSNVTSINLAGCKITDACARALAAALGGASSTVESLNLERNALTEAGLLELVRAIASNVTLRELKLTGQATPLTTPVEVAIAEMLDGGGAPSLVKLGPPMRNPNEKRRVDAALSRNMDAVRKKRQQAKAAA